jgi:hypothetical protein
MRRITVGATINDIGVLLEQGLDIHTVDACGRSWTHCDALRVQLGGSAVAAGGRGRPPPPQHLWCCASRSSKLPATAMFRQ